MDGSRVYSKKGNKKTSGRAYLLGDGARRRRNGKEERQIDGEELRQSPATKKWSRRERQRQKTMQDERGAGVQEDDRWPVGSGGVGGD